MLSRLNLGQITLNPVKNALASQQLGFLATRIAMCDVLSRACAEIKIMSLGFMIFDIFLGFSFFSFSFLFAAVIDLLLGLLAAKNLLGKRHRDGLSPWSSPV